jgi:hypothetical protein
MVVAMIVVVVIPVAVAVPAVGVFIPPAMVVFPAVGSRGGEFAAPVPSLTTVRAVMLDGFVKLVVGPDDALLTIVFCANYGGTYEQNRPQEKHGGHCRTYFSHALRSFVDIYSKIPTLSDG